MKKTLIVALFCAFILSSCSNGAPSSSSSISSDPNSNLSVSQPEAENTNSSSAPSLPPISEPSPVRPTIADAAVYRGTISDITDTSFILAQADGRDFGAATVNFSIDENTKFSTEKSDLKSGMYVEVYYGVPFGKAPDYTVAQTAIQVNKISDDVNSSVYNGEVISIEYKEGSKDEGRIHMKTIEGDRETIFLFSKDTQFYMNKDDIKAGAKLNIFRSGIETRSIPPQTQAYEISLYKDLEIK